MPLKTHRLSVNQPVAGGNPQCIGLTTERVPNSGTGFEFQCAALRKKAPLQMRRDNLFLTEFPMKNRCSYFRISSLSKKNSQQLSLSLSCSFDVSSHSRGAGFNGPQSQIFTSLNSSTLDSENTLYFSISFPVILLSARNQKF